MTPPNNFYTNFCTNVLDHSYSDFVQSYLTADLKHKKIIWVQKFEDQFSQIGKLEALFTNLKQPTHLSVIFQSLANFFSDIEAKLLHYETLFQKHFLENAGLKARTVKHLDAKIYYDKEEILDLKSKFHIELYLLEKLKINFLTQAVKLAISIIKKMDQDQLVIDDYLDDVSWLEQIFPQLMDNQTFIKNFKVFHRLCFLFKNQILLKTETPENPEAFSRETMKWLLFLIKIAINHQTASALSLYKFFYYYEKTNKPITTRVNIKLISSLAAEFQKHAY